MGSATGFCAAVRGRDVISRSKLNALNGDAHRHGHIAKFSILVFDIKRISVLKDEDDSLVRFGERHKA